MRGYLCESCQVMGATMSHRRRCWRCGRFARRVSYPRVARTGFAPTRYTTQFWVNETRSWSP